jgi:hypothetical protein
MQANLVPFLFLESCQRQGSGRNRQLFANPAPICRAHRAILDANPTLHTGFLDNAVNVGPFSSFAHRHT